MVERRFITVCHLTLSTGMNGARTCASHGGITFFIRAGKRTWKTRCVMYSGGMLVILTLLRAEGHAARVDAAYAGATHAHSLCESSRYLHHFFDRILGLCRRSSRNVLPFLAAASIFSGFALKLAACGKRRSAFGVFSCASRYMAAVAYVGLATLGL